MPTIQKIIVRVTRATRCDLRDPLETEPKITSVGVGEILELHPGVADEMFFAQAAVKATPDELAAYRRSLIKPSKK